MATQTPTRTPISQPDLASPQFKADPYPFYARLRDEAPVYRATIDRRRAAWLITRYDDALAALKDERFVKDPQNAAPPGGKPRTMWVPPMLRPLSRNMLDLDAPDHTRLRSLVHKAFTPRYVEHLRGRVQSLADDLLDAAERAGECDLIRDLARPLPLTVIAEMLGVPERDRPRFARWSETMVAISSQADGLRAIPAIWSLLRFLRGLIAARRANLGDDLLSALIRAEEEGDRLSADELVAMAAILLTAGFETTMNLIGNGTHALLRHPEQADTLRRDPAGIGAAVEELLRYTSPVNFATERYAREPVRLHDTTIPQGDLVLVALGAANRDERQFPHADTLDLAREPNRHLAFGQGGHYCVGAPLARLEGQIALGTLLARYPDLRLATAPEMLTWRRGLVIRGLERLPLSFR